MTSASTNAFRRACAAITLIAAAPVAANAQGAVPDIVVTEKDNGRDITLHGSQRLIIRLTDPGGPSSWSALMRPDSILAFTETPVPEGERQHYPATTPQPAAPVIGGPHDQIIAFRPISFTESSSQWFTLIFCDAQCDFKDPSARIFKLAITTKKN
jgi:hypothetical protein